MWASRSRCAAPPASGLPCLRSVGSTRPTALHPQLVHVVEHLYAVDQRGAASDRCGDVHRLGHLLEVGALLQSVSRIRVDAVRALHGVRHGERDERLLPRRQRPLAEHGAVPVEELPGELAGTALDLAEAGEVVTVIVMRAIGHRGSAYARGTLRRAQGDAAE